EGEPSIKRTVDGVLFEMLRRDGYQACEAWLQEHRPTLGKHSSVDVQARYLAPFSASAGGAPGRGT
ncbi:MAG TPA: hypothetical protein VNB23_04820, partial [Ramlibacter sp.]|nr:hypothetical protein [Ramlibacter sp.]